MNFNGTVTFAVNTPTIVNTPPMVKRDLAKIIFIAVNTPPWLRDFKRGFLYLIWLLVPKISFWQETP